MTDALSIVLKTPWTRQGEWGGGTLSRSLTYGGMQRSLPDWTGVAVGHESFLHCGETTYIATGQYERFAQAMLARLERERTPLRAFTARFDDLLGEVRAFLPTLKEEKRHEEKLARYLHLHQQMQPYSYVFGYGEDQIVGDLLDRLLSATTLDPETRGAARAAAISPLHDETATRLFAKLRRETGDARALDFAELVRRQLQVRTDRRILWNKVEEAIRPHLARRAERASLPLRLLLEATPPPPPSSSAGSRREASSKRASAGPSLRTAAKSISWTRRATHVPPRTSRAAFQTRQTSSAGRAPMRGSSGDGCVSSSPPSRAMRCRRARSSSAT